MPSSVIRGCSSIIAVNWKASVSVGRDTSWEHKFLKQNWFVASIITNQYIAAWHRSLGLGVGFNPLSFSSLAQTLCTDIRFWEKSKQYVTFCWCWHLCTVRWSSAWDKCTTTDSWWVSACSQLWPGDKQFISRTFIFNLASSLQSMW